MTKFLENVLHLLSEKGISKNKMLTELKLGKNSFVNWESRGTIPSGTTLHKIAEYFNVSTDYLLGIKTSEELQKGCDFMSTKLTKDEILTLAKEKGVKISYLNKLIGGYRGKLTDWKNGKTTLNETELSTITDYLLGTETSEEPLDETDQQILMLARKSRVLSPEDKEKFMNVLKGSVDAFLDKEKK